MTDDQRAEFTEKLTALVAEYGITHASFCGTEEADEETALFFGRFIGPERMSVANLAEAAINVGRLWQHARESLAAEQIAAAVERLHKGRLNEHAILLLIRDACHPTVSMQTIKIVLNTVRRLPEIYLLKPETKGKK